MPELVAVNDAKVKCIIQATIARAVRSLKALEDIVEGNFGKNNVRYELQEQLAPLARLVDRTIAQIEGQ